VSLDNSAEAPLPVRQVSRLIGDWVHRLGSIWVEGEIAQLNRRPGAGLVFLTLRDPEVAMSLSVTCSPRVLDAAPVPLVEGARVVVHGRPSWYAGRGTLSMTATEFRTIGLGELLARIEVLRGILAAEGLFSDTRKQPLPFLPSTIGLISGRASAAERDVVDNARRRWPAARFRIESTPVQGAAAVPAIVAALAELDADPEVAVIVIARGGGSVEDLLPFSDEVLLRAVSTCRTPVVSAIGHEQDAPLLDLVADVRASTPTDAARRIVPDLAAEQAGLTQALGRIRRLHAALLEREQARLLALRQAPVLRSATDVVGAHRTHLVDVTGRLRRCLIEADQRRRVDLLHQRQRLHLLSPASTLERGYAIALDPEGRAIRSVDQVGPHEPITLRVADGSFTVERTGSDAPPTVTP
jgi:exodeoxyribonuclease VII large subunit